MRAAPVVATLALALQGCSNESAEAAAGQETASSPAAEVGVAVTEAPPADVDMQRLEPLGDVANVDLGTRDGSCTFAYNGTPLLLAAAPDDAAASGNAVVRAGGTLYLLRGPRGGIAAVRAGTLFTGAGFMVRIAALKPERFNKAQIEIRDAKGQTFFVGEWNCA